MEIISLFKKTNVMSFLETKGEEPVKYLPIQEISELNNDGSFGIQYNQMYMSRYQKIKDRFYGHNI